MLRRRAIHARAIRALPATISPTTASSSARIETIARQKGCTPAQLVLAWLLAQGPT